MPQSRKPKRPGPKAYDHLWTLLPVFVAFIATIVLVAAPNDRPLQAANAAELAPMPTVSATQDQQGPADTSVPSAAAAMTRLLDAVAEPVATY
jgi:hypothetical protein